MPLAAPCMKKDRPGNADAFNPLRHRPYPDGDHLDEIGRLPRIRSCYMQPTTVSSPQESL
jgi:hypothetical protein